MSYHVIHVLTHGATLHKKRGRMVMAPPSGEKASATSIPIEDVRMIVVAARGVTITNDLLSSLLKNDGAVLHCGPSYEPIGMTMPLPRIVDIRAQLAQSARPKTLNRQIWRALLYQKVTNQLGVLREHGDRAPYLERALRSRSIDEANCARHYWKRFFPRVGYPDAGRNRENSPGPNKLLNYGYAVMTALCHRAIVAHGLTPLLGVHHKGRFRSDPLVYDLVEPFRPIVDRCLVRFLDGPDDKSLEAWSRWVGRNLHALRLGDEPYPRKLIDAIDKGAGTLARSYRVSKASELWLPSIAA